MRQNTSQSIEDHSFNQDSKQSQNTTVKYLASQVSLSVLAHVKTVQKEIANNPQPTNTQDP
jgi:hypothetical protein